MAEFHAHRCPRVEPELAVELAARLRGEPWLMQALEVVAASGLPDARVGAGVIRDVIWGQRHGSFDPAQVRDIDVAFFDAGDLSKERDHAAQRALVGVADLTWEATNQAAVHTWFHEYFGGPPMQPFSCVHDAVATWPETATCVAVRLAPSGIEHDGAADGIEICAPHGLADLLNLIWRPNRVRVTSDIAATRLARIASRFPSVTIAPPAPAGAGRVGSGRDGGASVSAGGVGTAPVSAVPISTGGASAGRISAGRAPIEEFLREQGASQVPHPGGTLLAHLGRVADLLAEWGADEALQFAGLCHAAYGTDGFDHPLLPVSERGTLAALIGTAAEELVYLYDSCDRRATYPLLREAGPVSFRNRFTGQPATPSERTVRAFAELTAANELDLVRHNPAVAADEGPGLRALFEGWRRWLSDAAAGDWATTAGPPS